MPFSLRGATKVNADGAAARDAQQAHEGEDDAPDCWICACPATRKNPLIFPCACRGTMSGVHGACVEPAPCLVMAFAAGGGLDQAVREGRFTSVPDVIKLLAGIARGMEAVHAHKVIHLDLKPENVLLSADNVPWVTDFGLSTSTNLASMSTSSVGGRGTLYYKVRVPACASNPQETY